MSRADLPPIEEQPRSPARRRALFDLALGAAALPTMPVLARKPAAPPPLRVMHGFADSTGITLWLQGARAEALEVDLRRGDEPAAPAAQVLRVPLDARSDFTESLVIGGLEPGTQYSYTVRAAKSKAALARGTFGTQPYWHYRTDPPTVRIATGSCAYMNDFRFDRPGKPYGGGEEIFDSIAAARPDLMLWLGDNIYLREAEYTSRDGINRRYRFYRSHPALQKLWSATPHVAIWDDHDYGPDNSDLSYSGRGWTREMFLRYWPLPYTPPADGLYGKVLQGDVDIFMLDDRSYRDHDRWPGDDKAMYGPKQMKWLKTALLYSRAPFKLIAGGSQFFNRASRSESWLRYPAESQDFLRFLAEARIPGVLFLSGDRHFTEHLRIERQGLYALNEFTISPLTSGPSSSLNDAERANPDLVRGSLLDERNFAILTVTGPRLQRSLAIEVHDTKGQKKWEWTTTAAALAEGTQA
jgi:alkaline phosphatase D